LKTFLLAHGQFTKHIHDVFRYMLVDQNYILRNLMSFFYKSDEIQSSLIDFRTNFPDICLGETLHYQCSISPVLITD